MTTITGEFSHDRETYYKLSEVYDQFSPIVYSLIGFVEDNKQEVIELHLTIFRKIVLEFKTGVRVKQNLFPFIWNIAVNTLRSKGYILDRNFFRRFYNIG